MKNIQKSFVRSILVVLFIAVGAGRTLAYDHDRTGWFDAHHHHQPFVQHGGHRGYWDHNQSGALIFIRV
jgi:hypothetical protein